jgi:hypothetical protein
MSTNFGYLTPWHISKLDDIAEWKEAMMLKMDAINRCKVWEIVKRSEANNILPTRWVLCRKGGDKIRKARLVVCGDKQEKQTHLDKTYAPT